MKRNIKSCGIFAIILILTFGLIFAFGCENKNPFVEGLTAEQAETIRHTYFNERYGESEYGEDINNVIVRKYFFTYDGNVVIDLYDGHLFYVESVTSCEIGGVTFACGSQAFPYYIYLNPEKEYNHNIVLCLDEAYEKDYISCEKLQYLADMIRELNAV